MKNNKDFYTTFSNYFLSVVISALLMSFSLSVNAAEYVYISDNLRVGVRPEPVSSVPPISVVLTGMRLELHERSDGYVKITTDKGITGWVRDIYVTKKAPAIIQLNAFQVKYDKLIKENSSRSDTVAELEKENATLTEQIDELKSSQSEWAKERADLVASQYEDSSYFWLIVVIALIILSFASGILWYKKYVMNRLGGLRV